jgi:hypothetical protein
MQYLEGSGMPVLYIGRTVLKGSNLMLSGKGITIHSNLYESQKYSYFMETYAYSF